MGLSENLRKFRIKKDLKQEDIALKVGKTKSVISNWEKGINRPDADTIILLCSILDTTPNELLDWDFINQNKSDFNSQNQKQKTKIAGRGGGIANIEERKQEYIKLKQKLIDEIRAAELDMKQLNELIAIIRALEKL
ncbi:MAG: helix-turn-helix transcriptional regulator [Clostridiales bacterium]|nr:helix-turn-helix transcriptional regulator [Clostridiales bacterium]